MQDRHLVLLLVAGLGLTALTGQAFGRAAEDRQTAAARAVHQERLIVAGKVGGPAGKLATPPPLPSAPQLRRPPSGVLPDRRQGPYGRSNPYGGGWSDYCEQNPHRPSCLRRAPVRDSCRQNPLRKECRNRVKTKNP